MRGGFRGGHEQQASAVDRDGPRCSIDLDRLDFDRERPGLQHTLQPSGRRLRPYGRRQAAGGGAQRKRGPVIDGDGGECLVVDGLRRYGNARLK